jgi:RNA polymerase II elongation factor ELL
MAAILTQGRRFNLSSVPTNKNSSVLYVKLTDSSLKAIEEYQQAKNLKRKASISFSETIGALSFPQKDSETPRVFDFAIQPSKNDDCFQCIKHSKANGIGNLESLGVLSQKLTIQAGDDVYENTLKKMSIVEEQSKKPRTKEIKSSGPNNGSRLRKILRNVARNSQNPSSTRHTRSQAVSSSTQRKQATASIHAQPKVTPASRAALSSSPNGRISPFAAAATKEKNGSTAVAAVAATASVAMGFALRDRIIHLLAIKNYKKPELLLKLQLDGLSDKDKDLFMPTLELVAQVNSRDNSYNLQRHLYTSDVKHDWPLYSDTDRQQLNRKLSVLTLNPPLNPRTISPCPSNGSQGSPPRTKRSTELVDLAPKRLTDDGTAAAVTGSASKRQNDLPDTVPPPKRVRVAHTAKRGEKGRQASLAQSIQNGLASQGYSLQTGSTTSGVSPGSDLAEDMADASCDPEDEDFKRIFTTIQSYEQRCRYKIEFNKGHKEHQEVYHRISSKVATIVELQAQIKQETDGSPQYDLLRNEIFEEYLRLKNDVDYVKDRNRYEHLVKKLAHIKQLVYAYDHDHPASSK